MTAREPDTLQTGDRLPNLDLPLDERWHDEDGTVALRAGPRRAALLLYLPHLPHGASGAPEIDGEDAARRSPCGPCRSFIENLMDASETITLKDGTIAVASPEGRQMLADRVGISETEAHLIVTDRFGEIWEACSIGADHEDGELVSIPDLVEWVDYLGTQCPECGVLDTTDRSWRTI